MKNISLYIARRYNTSTLITSMMLIVISAFLVGSLVYIGDLAIRFFYDLLFPDKMISGAERILIISLAVLFIIGEVALFYLLFNKVSKWFSKWQKIGISFLITAVFGFLAIAITQAGFAESVWGSFLVLAFGSISLLSLFFGVLALLFSKRKVTGVNIITSIAVFAITIATTALFTILSVFSGLQTMNIELFSTVNPDLRISPAKGKALENIDELTAKLKSNADVAAFSKVIEEKVSIEFNDKQDIAYIKGVDSLYSNVVRVDTAIVHGNFLDFKMPYEILASDGVARRLQMYIDYQHAARLRMPKPGTGLIKSEEEAFNTAVANPVGVFILNEKFDKYIFSPIGLTQILLQLPENSAYSLELKLRPGITPKAAKASLQKELGNDVVVETRQDMDATFLKVMNMENLITYLIFTLVIIIASFNLAGAIIIIILDKKRQIKTMWGFGMQLSHIKQIFFKTGLLITLFSILFGLILGTVLGVLQKTFHLVMATAYVPFPFEFRLFNYLVVVLTVLIIGGLVSWLVSRRLPI